jgi:hypothetical protein
MIDFIHRTGKIVESKLSLEDDQYTFLLNLWNSCVDMSPFITMRGRDLGHTDVKRLSDSNRNQTQESVYKSLDSCNRSLLVGQTWTPECCPPRKRHWARLREDSVRARSSSQEYFGPDYISTCPTLSKFPAAVVNPSAYSSYSFASSWTGIHPSWPGFGCDWWILGYLDVCLIQSWLSTLCLSVQSLTAMYLEISW